MGMIKIHYVCLWNSQGIRKNLFKEVMQATEVREDDN